MQQLKLAGMGVPPLKAAAFSAQEPGLSMGLCKGFRVQGLGFGVQGLGFRI